MAIITYLILCYIWLEFVVMCTTVLCLCRYIHVGSHTAAAADNMKRFLNLIPKLHLRHRYAKELGFHDIAAIVLEEESEEFLNDLEALG